MKKVAILTRVSTHKQATDRQLLELENYCRDHDYLIVGTISSIVSGRKKIERPDLEELIGGARRKEFDLLIVTEISRISRKPEVLRNFIDTLRKCGIPILFKNLGLFSMDENGKESFATNVIISIFSELAAEEVRQLSERVKSGLDAARARGKIIGRPAGKYSTRDILRKHSKIVKYLQDGMSLPETAKLTGASYNTCKKVKSLIS
jgi:DNA invertase Pin-like site-specific DNA recombinase